MVGGWLVGLRNERRAGEGKGITGIESNDYSDQDSGTTRNRGARDTGRQDVGLGCGNPSITQRTSQ